MTEVASGRARLVLPGVSMTEFDIESNLDRVAYTSLDSAGNPHAWVAPLDHSKPPTMIVPSVARQACFAAGGDIYLLAHEGNREFVYRVGTNQSGAQKMSPKPYTDFSGLSPLGDLWMLNYDTAPEVTGPGGTPVPICHSCGGEWGREANTCICDSAMQARWEAEQFSRLPYQRARNSLNSLLRVSIPLTI